MMFKVILVAAAAVSSLCLAQEPESPGIPVQWNNRRIVQQALTMATCDGTRVYSTCSGCNEATVCLGKLSDFRSCPQQNPDKPYCNDGKCTDVPNFGPDCPLPTFTCTGAGYFPDPRSCRHYHVCRQEGAPSQPYDCKQGRVFNPVTGLCKTITSAATECMTIQCESSEIFAKFGDSKRYFGYCMPTGGATAYSISVFQCAEGTEFNGYGCVFKCTAEGRFPYPSNPAMFYECSSATDQVLPQACPFDTVFNEQSELCLPPPPK